MKKLIVLFLLCSCGKTAIDQPTVSGSALTAHQVYTQACQSRCQRRYDECMKLFSPYDPIETRTARLQLCEVDIRDACVSHCDWCSSVNWDIYSPQVFHHETTCTTCTSAQTRYCVGFIPVCTTHPDTYQKCEQLDYTP